MKQGFTLIELFIVIALIAIISSAIILPHTESLMRKSRDAKRLSDMGNLEMAIHTFYADRGRYPDRLHDNVGRGGGAWPWDSSGECIGGAVPGTTYCYDDYDFEEVMAPYMRGGVPVDPLYATNAEIYYYAYDPVANVDWCDDNDYNDVGYNPPFATGAWIPVLQCHRAETQAIKNLHHKDCCFAGDMDAWRADYNVAFEPPSDKISNR